MYGMCINMRILLNYAMFVVSSRKEGEREKKSNTYQLRFAEVPRTCGSLV
jgi:hypothetical protein